MLELRERTREHLTSALSPLLGTLLLGCLATVVLTDWTLALRTDPLLDIDRNITRSPLMSAPETSELW